MYGYDSARSLFDAARAAAIDAARASQELEAMEANEGATSYASPSLEPRVRTGCAGDRIARIVATRADRRERLEQRLEADYAVIDAACALLYGDDQEHDGLAALTASWTCDAIYHHFLGLRTWDAVAGMLGYSKRYVLGQVAAAFELADSNGAFWTRRGVGMAEA